MSQRALSSCMRCTTALLLAVLVTGCKSQDLRAEALPFHVAVIPFETSVSRPGTMGFTNAGSPTDFDLAFEGDGLARVFGDVLDTLSFSLVTVLELPEGVSAATFATWPRARRETHWLEAAGACRADLVLEGLIEYDPVVRSEVISPGLWGSLWVFELLWKYNWLAGNLAFPIVPLLGDIGLWSKEDRAYYCNLSFDGSLHEVSPMLDAASDADLTNDRAVLLRLSTVTTQAQLRFKDRAGFFAYAASFVVMAPLLPGDSDVEHESLREELAEQMLFDIVQQVGFRRARLLQAEGVFPFEVESVGLLSHKSGDTEVYAVLELATDLVDEMDGYRIWVEDELVVDAFFEGPVSGPSPGRDRYVLSERLPGLEPGAWIQLELRDAAAKQNVRTFTLVVGITGKNARKKLSVDLPLPEPLPEPAPEP